MQAPIHDPLLPALGAVLVALCAGLAATGIGHATEAPAATPVPALDDCRRLVDDRARLACFDAALPRLPALAGSTTLPVSPASPSVATTAPTAVAGAVVPASVTAPARLPANGATQPLVLLPQLQQKPEESAQAQAEFGLPRVLPRDAIDALTSRISGAFSGWSKGAEIRLENGQVWVVNDESVGVYRLSSPTVTIRRGSFGSFFLEIEGVQQTPRVRRVR